jgi:hypothetical protein
MRKNIETFLRRALRREQRQIASVVAMIRPTTLGGEPGYRCRLRLWSHYLGDIVVSDVGPSVRSALHPAMTRARQAVRRRIHKRLAKFRRIKRSQLQRWLSALAPE